MLVLALKISFEPCRKFRQQHLFLHKLVDDELLVLTAALGGDDLLEDGLQRLCGQADRHLEGDVLFVEKWVCLNCQNY